MRRVVLTSSTLALLAIAACTGEDGANGAPGTPGAPGVSCTVTDNGDGTKTVTCGTTTVTVNDGVDGTPGTDGASCTGADNGDGTFTITCDNGTMIIVTNPGFIPPAYAAADAVAGGAAYGKWWVTQAGGAGSLAAEGVTVGSEWVRCKTCHAWDGLGNAASYANRTGQSTGTASRPDVSTVDLWPTIAATTPTQLFTLIKGSGGRPINSLRNSHPDYSATLSDAQIWNLVKFMREGWIYPDDLYFVAVDGPPVYTNAAGVVVPPVVTFYGVGTDGDPVHGNALYTAGCASCHGANGTTINMAGASVGELARTKPNEVWHKLRYGVISDTSVATMAVGLVSTPSDLADIYAALANPTAFPDL